MCYAEIICKGQAREVFLKGKKAQYSLHPSTITSLKQLLFILKILFTFFTKQATLRRSN